MKADPISSFPAFQEPRADSNATAFTHEKWLPRYRGEESNPPFLRLDLEQGQVYVGSRTLPIIGDSSPLVPRPEAFVHVCIDTQTAALLHHLATAVALGESQLLVGDTSTSKSSSVRLLAALCQSELYELSLSRDTDVAELVGTYVPSDRGDRSTGGSASPAPALWRWQPGPVVQALRSDRPLLLDELNLAASSVGERVNSLLDPHGDAKLVLAERDSEVVRPVPGGHFRILATQNPTRTIGRQALSQPFRSRWVVTRVRRPDETALRDMLTTLATGKQPAIHLGDQYYAGWPLPRAAYPELNRLGEETLEALARFHVSLDHAFLRADDAGALQSAPPPLTRRTLLAVVNCTCAFGASRRTLAEAIDRYFVSPASDEQRMVALRVQEAHGLRARPSTPARRDDAVNELPLVLTAVRPRCKGRVARAISRVSAISLRQARALVRSLPATFSLSLHDARSRAYARAILEAAGAVLAEDDDAE